RFSRDWSSDVCSSDLCAEPESGGGGVGDASDAGFDVEEVVGEVAGPVVYGGDRGVVFFGVEDFVDAGWDFGAGFAWPSGGEGGRSEERRVGKEGSDGW